MQGREYKLFNDSRGDRSRYAEAESYCQTVGNAHLASIGSAAENNVVSGLLNAATLATQVWVGGRFPGGEDSALVWEDGTVADPNLAPFDPSYTSKTSFECLLFVVRLC